MPLVIPLAYYLILPMPEAVASVQIPASYEEEEAPTEYISLPTEEDEPMIPKSSVALSAEDKWYLVKPLLLKYMVPLCEWLQSPD